eukprot:TRINITY_DN8138_c0_g1_i1.p1 TRINITY_DN8138_c0_g1~~TRINITY_DN8138_c0_g1_i1.p1  ORF type:complete len:100 (+),score=27.02 TRINITY_DN8138_c0_g1_i1:283-582(+)
MVDFPKHLAVTGNTNEKEYTNLLKDFIADQKSRKSIIQDWNKMEENKKKVKASFIKKEIKTSRRGRNSVQKMKDRKELKNADSFCSKKLKRRERNIIMW